MSKRVPRTRVVVAGVDISDAVLSTTSARQPAELETVVLVLAVDRLSLVDDYRNGGQELTYHIAEGLID